MRGRSIPTNHSSSQKTRLNVLSYGIIIWTDLSSVFHNSGVWQTDRYTDGRTEFWSLDNACIPCSAVKKLVADFGLLRPTQPSIPPGSVNEYQLRLGRQRQVYMVHSVSGWTRGVQVKLWDPLRTRAIPERLRGVSTTRRYTNTRLPLALPLPLLWVPLFTHLVPVIASWWLQNRSVQYLSIRKARKGRALHNHMYSV